MDKLDSSTIKGLTIFLALNLAACVTPALIKSDKWNICNSSEQTDSIKAQTCHYFGRHTPYQRKRVSKQYASSSVSINTSPLTASTALIDATLEKQAFGNLKLSKGDKLNIGILNGEEFSSDVEVNADGYIYLPYLAAIKAQGLSFSQLKLNIEKQLIHEQLMLSGTIRISVLPLRWAPIEITVSGAVFEPGLHLINHKSDTELKDDANSHTGDQASERSIPAALRASGGISPDADLENIIVTRGTNKMSLDLSGVINGNPVPQLTLMANDHIHVPQKDIFNDELARPSQITAPGIRVFISNLTQPASSNSQSAVDTDATRFPYGTRLLTGAIGGNCVGGAQSTNASRYILLITKNPMTKQVDVIERSIDSLIAQSWQPQMNPILLPGDGIACYDSGVTNLREIARTITEIIVPATLLGVL
ncbi:polysaccharide biosynthesis/export family protein [Shewanella eurypsychrophilus]|uniref:Polysaccharide biosynthesis/export family protein n=1 Tax=Shewanella eurypsychrophilus TaxID=2593656 RepID=A0ABX6V895_9GAMM|nr:MULTISPECIES: polysaccharide biosynthesis/export family protein [Shewanella]QFU23411.1 polysaccharide export protein [Shewanella sp. YLB-09]QPG58640.1 polysaccharide biosynthesis/export family protein [Shewanella eurypsychrophilus]